MINFKKIFMKRKNIKNVSTDLGEAFVASLNLSVKLDHIDDVDHGVSPIDDRYRRSKQELIKLWGKKKYDRESLKRENLVEALYHTDWKSRRISH